jgi:sugar lactone lactonase YvrE
MNENDLLYYNEHQYFPHFQPVEAYPFRQYFQTLSSRIGKYKLIFHWNHLNWNFPNEQMMKEFYENQYWKKCIPAGVKVDQQGNYYVSVPRLAHGIPATMNRIVMKNGKPLLEAFPNWEWNNPEIVNALRSVLGYEIDEYNRMWILDQGKIAYEPSPEGSQKLVIWDLNRDQLIDSIVIPNEIVNYRTSFLNDVVVDNKNGFVYITDSGGGWPAHPVKGGIIVFNMRTKWLRRVLDRHYSSQDFPGFDFEIDLQPVTGRFGADGIALSANRSTLYYCPLTGRNLYAIDTKLLRDFYTPLEEISRAVKSIGSKGTTTDGMHADNKGNVFYTMLEGKGVGYYNPQTNSFNPFVSDDRMLWVDGVAFDQKGSIIFNNDRLHQIFHVPQTIDWTYPYNFNVWKAFVGHDVKSYLY